MSKRKKYKFSNKDKTISVNLMAYSDEEAIMILGSIVNNLGMFTQMKSYKVK